MEILPDPSSLGVVEGCCRSLGKLLFIHSFHTWFWLSTRHLCSIWKKKIIQFGHYFKGSKHQAEWMWTMCLVLPTIFLCAIDSFLDRWSAYNEMYRIRKETKSIEKCWGNFEKKKKKTATFMCDGSNVYCSFKQWWIQTLCWDLAEGLLWNGNISCSYWQQSHRARGYSYHWGWLMHRYMKS